MLSALITPLIIVVVLLSGAIAIVLCVRGRARRALMACFGLLKWSPGQHRCHFCDLFDDERSACLVFVKTPKGIRNLRITRFSLCAWRGKAGQYVSVLDVDTEIEKVKMELEGAKTVAHDKNGDTGDRGEVHTPTAQPAADHAQAATDTSDEDQDA